MTQTYLEHVTGHGDRWDLIAHRYYSDAKLIRQLLMANLDLIGDPDTPVPLVLDPGLTLRVPVLDAGDIAAVQLPPWKRNAP